MHWLLLSILFSSLLMIIFVLFKKLQVNTFYAIVINYLVCVLIALFFAKDYSFSDYMTGWLPLGLVLGMFFISLFFLIAKTTQKMGASVTTVAMKLGYVIPIFLAFTYYGEQTTPLKTIGIILTVLAVLFTSFKKDQSSKKIDYKLMALPIIIFIGSGVADSIVQNVSIKYFSNGGFEMFNLVIFFTAFCVGMSIALFNNIKKKQNFFTKKTILAGILLGLPNYFSIYFLFQALNVEIWEDSFVFPVNNIGIVILSTVLAVIIFKEKLNRYNLIGLVLAVISILVLNLQSIY
tara:strand:+ start:594 stop:1469 length:876 start_codon:yes stop_codon:yes gene_type:complete